MAKRIILAIVLTATAAYGAGEFGKKGGTATTAANTISTGTFGSYTTSHRPMFTAYSSNAVPCWKSNGTLSYCRSTPTNGICTCK